MKKFFTSLSICISIATIGIVIFLCINPSYASNFNPSSKSAHQTERLTVSKIPTNKLPDQTVKFDELTTNLNDGSYIALTVNAVADSKNGAEEAKTRDFQFNDYVIKQLSVTSPEQMSNPAFVKTLMDKLKSYMNKQMTDGTILEMYITKKLVQ